MKGWIAVFLAALLFCCTGCTGSSPAEESSAFSQSFSEEENSDDDMSAVFQISQENSVSTASPSSQSQEEENMKLQIIVNDAAFYAELYDNPVAEAFGNLLPLTLSMSELNGNEKY